MGTLLVSGWRCVPASVWRGSLHKVLIAVQDWKGRSGLGSRFPFESAVWPANVCNEFQTRTRLRVVLAQMAGLVIRGKEDPW